MGSSAGILVVLLLLNTKSWCFAGDAEDFWNDPSYLQCGPTDLQFFLPFLSRDSAFVLTAVDNKGKSNDLHNNSACGTWVRQELDGSMVVGAAYDGCFVSKKDGEYLMTISLEEVIDDMVSYNKKDLKCPILPVMDAPSRSVCSSILREDKLPCGGPLVGKDLCEGVGCCFDPSDSATPCYYGNKLTAQCTQNIMVVAVSKELTMPSLILDSVHVADVDSVSCPQLTILKSRSFIVFQFPLSCGVMHQVNEDTMMYEGIIEANQDIRSYGRASITRDSTARVTVQCSYTRTAVLPLVLEVYTLPPPISVATTGPLFLEMRIGKDLQYNSYYGDGDYPVQKVLRDPVYVEVRLLQRTDPKLVLILNDCWANPSPDENQQPQWPILVSSCPFLGDDYLTQLIPLGASSQSIPLASHYKRFLISTFTFVDGQTQLHLGGMVYIHCSASVCVPSSSNQCSTTCGSRKKRQSNWDLEPQTTVTSGPVIFIPIEKDLSHWEFNALAHEVPLSDPFFAAETEQAVAEDPDPHYAYIESSTEEREGLDGESTQSPDGDQAEVMPNPSIPDLGGLEQEAVTYKDTPITDETPQGEFFGVERLAPRDLQPVIEGSGHSKDSTLKWLRGAVAVCGILAVTLTVLGFWRCRRNQTRRIPPVKA